MSSNFTQTCWHFGGGGFQISLSSHPCTWMCIPWLCPPQHLIFLILCLAFLFYGVSNLFGLVNLKMHYSSCVVSHPCMWCSKTSYLTGADPPHPVHCHITSRGQGERPAPQPPLQPHQEAWWGPEVSKDYDNTIIQMALWCDDVTDIQ